MRTAAEALFLNLKSEAWPMLAEGGLSLTGRYFRELVAWLNADLANGYRMLLWCFIGSPVCSKRNSNPVKLQRILKSCSQSHSRPGAARSACDFQDIGDNHPDDSWPN
jgi:hypothetical protein